MTRNRRFHPFHEPLRNQEALELQQTRINGPLTFLNPTRAFFRPTPSASLTNQTEVGSGQSSDPANLADTPQRLANFEFKWRSRDNRKGRHTLLVDPSKEKAPQVKAPQVTATYRAVGRGILRMALVYPYWDISYLVAISFTLGSVVWVLNSFFVFLPLPDPASEFKNEILTAGGVTAFVGATIFEFGSVLLMLEAVNEKRSGCFGWAVEKVLRDHGMEGSHFLVKPDTDGCVHHHANRTNLVGKGSTSITRQAMVKENSAADGKELKEMDTKPSWIWFPSTYDLKTHYLRDIGFLACLFQFLGATIFWISGFTALPGVNNKMSQGLLDGVFWTPQVIGGSGFIVSGFLFMLETQSKWYIPAFDTLGWHIGFWNLVGAFGFTLCGCLGFAYGNSGALYQSSLATFWGSWAFLIGSVIQWYESLDKYPVEKKHR